VAGDRYKYFRIEAAELLEQLSRAVLALEQDRTGATSVTGLLRQAHTLKGAARIVRQIEIADAAHAIEDELCRSQETGTAPDTKVLLALLDQCTRALSQLTLPQEDKTSQLSTVSAPLLPQRLVRAELSDVDAVREGVFESLTELSQLRADSSAFFACRELLELVERQVLAPRLSHVHQYEALLRSAHSTVSEALQNMRRFERRVNAALDRAERELQQAHESVERLRLVSAGTIFNGLERAVRDAAKELGKPVRFEAVGGDVKLDGHILDTVSRALVQLVRNAVAHGIESTTQRFANGKEATGLVRVEVRRASGSVWFSCRDDGNGIDVRQMRKLSGSSVEAELDGDALASVLLNAGVSTASHVSSVAGRGVGMGVVKDAIESLKATFHAENTVGKGLALTLCVPATLTSATGLLVDSGGEVCVLPLSNVQQTVRLASDAIATTANGEQYLRIGDATIPYAGLHALMGLPVPTAALRAAVVVVSGSERLAVGVVRVLGTKTQVVHRLPNEVGPMPTVGGVMLDAVGNPQLVLDVDRLVSSKRQVVITPRSAAPRKPILVVDDSLTTRMLQQSILESAGYLVRLADCAEQALEMASTEEYGLFLVDVEMPGMNGFQFVERTRMERRWHDIPAILVSSRSSPADLARGEAVGAKAYMVKDRFDQRELLRWIRGILGY
jgi:two-component system, chemotaxis family, sensor kinase CheA